MAHGCLWHRCEGKQYTSSTRSRRYVSGFRQLDSSTGLRYAAYLGALGGRSQSLGSGRDPESMYNVLLDLFFFF